MASLQMNGVYELTTEKIDEVINRKSAGNYALGENKPDGFYVSYVGRSDTDVNERLKKWVREKSDKYKHFKFSYASSPKAAFEKECKNYHEFCENESSDNDIHPQRPDNTNWECPNCDVFDDNN